MHNDYHSPMIRQLRDHHLRLAPPQRRARIAHLAQRLLAEVDSDRAYPYELVHFRITDRMPRVPCGASLGGRELSHDLPLLIDDLSGPAEIPPHPAGERVVTTEELAARFGVSTKTVARWRRQGLVSGRFVLDGRRRVGFLESSVDRFVKQNEDRVRRGAQFSQLSHEQRDRICARARRLFRAGASPAEVFKRLARKTGRSVETIRYTLKQHDRRHPASPILPAAHAALSDETKQRIVQEHQRGQGLAALAKRYGQSKALIERVVLQARARRLQELPLDYVPNPQFSEVASGRAEQAICGPRPVELRPARRARAPSGLPGYLASLYEVPLLTPRQEAHLFRKMNYLKYKASKLRTQLHADRPQAALMDRIERLYDEAVAVRNEIISANLRLVVSIARRYVRPGVLFFELVSDGNMSLMQAVDKFDFARGNKFSTYATWAIVKNFSRTIPTEHTRRRRFFSAPVEALAALPDSRGDQRAQEHDQSLREGQVGELLRCLDERERQIILRRFGLAQGQEPLKLREIGAEMGVTKERVRQLEIRAMEKMRAAAHGQPALTV